MIAQGSMWLQGNITKQEFAMVGQSSSYQTLNKKSHNEPEASGGDVL